MRLRCPSCHSEDRLECGGDTPAFGPPGTTSHLTCQACDTRYEILDGIPQLFVDDHRWRSKQRESEGWESYNAELGQLHYEGIGAPPIDFEIPHIDDAHWASIADNFDLITEGLDFTDKLVLDVGAGRPWAAKHFAMRGARAVAMDVNSHPVVGLGRGWAMMEQAGVEFDMFVGDCENLPLAGEQFDYVFISAAMHHTNFLRQLAREMARLLAPGGMVLIANEPTRSAVEDEGELLQAVAQPELRHGITERRPSTVDYLRALAASGLNVTDLFLGVSSARPQQIWAGMTEGALLPPRSEVLKRGGVRRTLGSLRSRYRNVHAEIDLRRNLSRKTGGIRSSHAQMMSALYARPDINIRAIKPH
ncbi:class I SAM-dependent methyltransferase [Acidimicrobium ferrooxidans]|uniref:Class I SAM-dependent methyltransferase n=1 Tax=Acidimicrobium ferrooxidans TaxID=53635 RepID=A0ABS3ANV1_9ACTN|nr:class I SAM-dependent methyltransferase [Acidimicrobium ferrooxidans]